MKAVPVLVVGVCLVGMSATTRAQSLGDAPLDVDYMHCGELACSYVYQGEGVSHPQLIVEIWRSGASQLTVPVYTFVYDYPNDAAPTLTFYIDAHLAYRMGASPVQLSEADILFMLPDGFVLSAGMERTFTNPETYHLDMWPSSSVLDGMIGQTVDEVPQGFVDWDRNYLGLPDGIDPSKPSPNPWTDGYGLTVCEVTESIEGLIIEDCIDDSEPPETPIGPGAEDFVVCDITEDIHGAQSVTCDFNEREPHSERIVISEPAVCYEHINDRTRSRSLVCDKRYLGPLRDALREEFTALSDCRWSRKLNHCPSSRELEAFDERRRELHYQIEADRSAAHHSAINQSVEGSPSTSAAEEIPACHPQALLGSPSVESCKGECDTCAATWAWIHSSVAAQQCGAALAGGSLLIGVGTTPPLQGGLTKIIAETAKKVAGTYSGAVSLAWGGCTALYAASKQAMRTAWTNSCKTWCQECLIGGNENCAY